MARTSCGRTGRNCRHQLPIWTRVALPLVALLIIHASGSCYAADSSSSPSFGFSIHHRFSDPVRSIFPAREDERLPEIGTVGYFAAMAQRDRIHGRRLASSSSDSTPLTFDTGNATYRVSSFGYLYYANVSVGTPGLDFLVALDTGSDLFWLPCDCVSCIAGFQTSDGQEIPFNIYGLNTSSTGKEVSCSSSLCDHKSSCVLPNRCPYEVVYLSSNTSSLGYLVEDVLHLTTDVDPSKPVDVDITFGCGRKQTGSFLNGGAPNGLFGLGIEKMSVPSILASKNVTADSFSMCFARGGFGRISFGDKGSFDQAETPFNLQSSHQTYNISITQITVGKSTKDVGIDAIFDTGTSFTIFTDPAYTDITEAFNSQVKAKRVTVDSSIPFNFCYEMSSCNVSTINAPSVNLTMKGGANYNVNHPYVIVNTDQNICFFCLGIIKDDNVNIIGQNLMTGYRVVFDREKMVLGWKESDFC
ncbi:hypothetical protein V2J09_021513 [Rumex salicifolius]